MTTATDPHEIRLAAVNTQLAELRAEMRRSDARHQAQIHELRMRHQAEMHDLMRDIYRVDERINVSWMIAVGVIFLLTMVGLFITLIVKL